MRPQGRAQGRMLPPGAAINREEVPASIWPPAAGSALSFVCDICLGAIALSPSLSPRVGNGF